MPIYDFRCVQCGTTFEELVRSTTRDDEVTCPECGGKQAERQIGAPSVLGASSSRGGGGCSAPAGSGFT
jgi:putative FmdB family regulatory protein